MNQRANRLKIIRLLNFRPQSMADNSHSHGFLMQIWAKQASILPLCASNNMKEFGAAYYARSGCNARGNIV